MNFKVMIPSPNQSTEDRLISDVIVHAAVIFCGKSSLDILKPFKAIMNNPSDLKVHNCKKNLCCL